MAYLAIFGLRQDFRGDDRGARLAGVNLANTALAIRDCLGRQVMNFGAPGAGDEVDLLLLAYLAHQLHGQRVGPHLQSFETLGSGCPRHKAAQFGNGCLAHLQRQGRKFQRQGVSRINAKLVTQREYLHPAYPLSGSTVQPWGTPWTGASAIWPQAPPLQDQLAPPGFRHRLAAALDPELDVDVLQVPLDRVHGETEVAPDLLVRQAPLEEAQNVKLAGVQWLLGHGRALAGQSWGGHGRLEVAVRHCQELAKVLWRHALERVGPLL